MEFPRIVLVLTAFGVLCSISIYWSYVQAEINWWNNQADAVQKETSDIEKMSLPSFQNLNKMKLNETSNRTSTSHNCKQCTNTDDIYPDDRTTKTDNKNSTNAIAKKRQIWISMGLCFSKNTEMYGKKYYPYSLVTPLAIILWYHFFPDIRVIIYLIYDKHEIDDRRKLYEEQLNQTNVEIRWVKEGDMNCVTKSQLIRMWAFQEPMIHDDDIIITVDVNLFVVATKILDPIYENPDMKIWVFQWYGTAFAEDGIGATFNQNLISAESKVWRQIVDPYEENMLNQKWLLHRVQEIGLERAKANDKWYYDQWITTYGILKLKLCTVPETSGLWKIPGLVENKIYFPNMNDTKTCWHGKDYQDCNRDIRIVAHGCKWWHFFPTQKFKEHVKKFNEITNNEYKLDFGTMFTNRTWNRLHP